jgi:hypothetical protein
MFRNITAAVWREHLAFVRERPVVRAETVNTLKVIIIPVDESVMHACMHACMHMHAFIPSPIRSIGKPPPEDEEPDAPPRERTQDCQLKKARC